MKISEELDDIEGIANCYGNIAIIYSKQASSITSKNISADKYNKAQEYFNKSLKIFEKLGNKKGIANSYLNIGEISIKLEENQKAIDFLTKGLNISKEINVLNLEKKY